MTPRPYEGPAGPVFSRAELERIVLRLTPYPDDLDRHIRWRINRYLDNDWEERAGQWNQRANKSNA